MRNDGVKYDKPSSLLMVCSVGTLALLGALCLVVFKAWVFIVTVPQTVQADL